MNTIALVIENRVGDLMVHALHNDVVLFFDVGNLRNYRVWQWRPEGGVSAARDWLVEVVGLVEKDGGRLFREPVMFDLSIDARFQIVGFDPGRWFSAALLREELLKAAQDPVRSAVFQSAEAS